MIEEVYKNISWLGHDGILYQNKKTIYFDPFQIAGGPAADIILISHDHFDHCSPDDVKKIQTKDTDYCDRSRFGEKAFRENRSPQTG